MLNPVEQRLIADLAERLQRAEHGQRDELVQGAMRSLGCGRQTVYRKLAEAGFVTGRKRRSDAGQCVLTEAQLQLLAGVLRASTNKKGQRLPVRDAIDMLRAGGQLPVDVSESTVSRQLYQRQMHPQQLAHPTPSVRMRSLHPNHVWQVDSTTGAYYYLPGGKLRFMNVEEFNHNKVHNLVKASSDLLTRYAIADHTSHAFKSRHYLGGETLQNLLDFLVWAICKQPHSPVHGVPFHLMMDPGGANRSPVTAAFCKRLGIEAHWHESSRRKDDAARVTGSVEKAHDLIRQHFEPRLRFEDPRQVTLDGLNEKLWAWEASYQASRVHGRHGRTRYAAWMEIAAEQLRVPDSAEALMAVATREPVRRRVANDRTIEFNGRTYDVAQVPGAAAGLGVTVAENLFRTPAVDVLYRHPDTGEESWHLVEPMQHDGWGFRVDGPVIGQEMRTAPHSEIDRTRNQFLRQAYSSGQALPSLEEATRARKAHAQAFAGRVDGMADAKANPAPLYLPRRATPLEVAARQIEPERLSVVQLCKQLMGIMGARYDGSRAYAHVSARYPSGGPQSAVSELLAELDAQAAAPDAPAAAAGGAR